MNYLKVSKKEKITRSINSNYIIHNYITKEVSKNASLAISELNGEHGKTKNIESDRIYFVLKGSGKFIIDNKEIEIKKGDSLFIKKDTWYNIIGNMELILINTPSFNFTKEVTNQNS
ncbi:MAG: cupin domain-containing protein [Alphaproteobacteria bacterium]|jgi:mannose-6-phosphate isomerase-like protein (cupin superfamily)|nr:cupin domain-containing protein [Alphaproteobacteria bacterium]